VAWRYARVSANRTTGRYVSCIIVAGPGLTAVLGPGHANVIGARTTDLADVVVREDAFIEGVERVGAGERVRG
jgi:hypothetical protein